mgnify:CR=1 FL=1
MRVTAAHVLMNQVNLLISLDLLVRNCIHDLAVDPSALRQVFCGSSSSPMVGSPEFKTCPSCDQSVSKYSLSCPKCGCNWQVRIFWKYYVPILGACICILLLAVLVRACNSSTKVPMGDVGAEKGVDAKPLCTNERCLHYEDSRMVKTRKKQNGKEIVWWCEHCTTVLGVRSN